MTKREETIGFLENVLRGTYFDSEILKHKQGQLELLRTPEGKESIEYSAKNSKSDVNRRAAISMLNNYDGIIVKLEVEIERMETQKTEYEEFMLQHHDVIDYIAALTSGSRKKVETPSEEIVFETLRRLSGKNIIGDLFGSPNPGATLELHDIVKTAAYEHAQRIDQNPESYYSRVTADQQATFIAL